MQNKSLRKISIILCTCTLFCCYTIAQNFKDIKYSITGVEGEILANIEKKLEIIKEDTLKKPTEKNLAYYKRNLKKNIARAIRPYGYYNADIKITEKRSKKTLYTTINIQLKRPIIINNIVIQLHGPGAPLNSLTRLIKKLPSKKGDRFDSIKYEKTKEILISWAAANGYIHADFTKNIVHIDTNKFTADIILHFDTKEQYYFGTTNISSDKVSHDLIMRYLEYKENDIFSSKILTNSYGNLTDSRLFKYINISPEFSTENNIIPINIEAQERKKIGIETSAGYATDRGFDSQISIEDRLVNTHGHTAKITTAYSSFLKSINLHYNIPGRRAKTDMYSVIIGARKITLSVGQSSNFKYGLTWSRTKVAWSKSLSLFFLHESYEIFRDNESRSSDLIIPEYNVSKRVLNDKIFPKSGYKISWNIRGASSKIISNADFIQTHLDIDFIFSLSSIRFVQRNKVGFLLIEESNKLPLSLRFLEGGNNSIRGYEYNSIGPGKYLYVSSIDVQVPILEKWYFSMFYDIGNVTDNLRSSSKSSAGIGAMWHSPIGPINAGIAKALQKNAPNFRIYFSVGIEI